MSEAEAGDARAPQDARRPWPDRILAALAAATLFLMMALVAIDVAARYVFNTPIKGGFEIVTFLLAAVVFVAMPLVTRAHGHITVTIFEAVYRGWVGWLQRLLVLIGSAVVMGGIAWRLWLQGGLLADGNQVTGFLEWPLAPVAYGASVLSAVTCLYLVAMVVGHVRAAGRSPRG